MHRPTIISFFFVIIVFSCDSDLEDIIISEDSPIIAGITTADGTHKIYKPPMEVNANNEIGCLHYYGIDSIDLNQDGLFDIQLSYWEQIYDISNSCCDYGDDPDIIVDCWPSGSQRFYIAVLDSSSQIACDSNKLVLDYEYGDTISPQIVWNNNKFLTLLSIYIELPDIDTFGLWTPDNSEYLGFRLIEEDTIYGWLKLRLGDRIKVEESYIESSP